MSAKLQKTKNYDMFELHECNRPESFNPHLAESMKEHGFMPSGAIHVKENGNGKLKIIRGHHRFREAQRQKLPVYYIQDDTHTDIFDLEGSSRGRWSMRDFAEARARAGDENYIKLLEFQKKHQIALMACASLLGGESAQSGNQGHKVKDGTFKVRRTGHAETVVWVIDNCREVGIDFSRQRGFVNAVSSACRVPEFDEKKFVSRIRKHPRLMDKRSTTDEYIEEIEEAYNHGAKTEKRIPLKLRVREVMRSRGSRKTG